MRKGRRWSEDDRREILHLRGVCGLSWAVIATRFPGTTENACKFQYFRAIASKPRRRAVSGEPLRRGDGRADCDPVASRVAPDVIVDRDRRRLLRLERADVTANFFGDPLPGYSARDVGAATIAINPSAKPTLYWGNQRRHSYEANY
ncbi:MAG: SANT/Myb-like DNA-binding domain-containing protein [Hyphomicrobium sp.]|uniref:SANT/Myb-like DNA-binding domain-containing protein n=1 Tax=Hyphomicrobium sp. TaxID=82 RepID=UPI00356B3286